MLGKVFARFVEKGPICVMVRGTLERALGADQLGAWFARTAKKQSPRTVLFSTVYDILSQVVFPSSLRGERRIGTKKRRWEPRSSRSRTNLTGSRPTPRRSWCTIGLRC
jgi:hypothetical protein